MADELKQRLDQGIYGAPKVNPDEQRKYLGTFRERCFLQMTIAQMKDSQLQEQFALHLHDFPNASCLINGALSESIQAIYLAILAKESVNFTIVSTESDSSDDAIGLLLVDSKAVDEPIIDIFQKYGAATSNSTEPKKKPSFFEKIFGTQD